MSNVYSVGFKVTGRRDISIMESKLGGVLDLVLAESQELGAMLGDLRSIPTGIGAICTKKK